MIYEFGGWIGVDLDGTLAKYTKFEGPDVIGEPIPIMVQRVKDWLKQGKEVRIFTARISDPAEADVAHSTIVKWCEEHIGRILPVTCTKDHNMIELWDDRAIQVIPNTGKRVDGKN